MIEDLLKDFEEWNGFYLIGVYEDKEGKGALYYNAKLDEFYKEKNYKYLVVVELGSELLRKYLKGEW